MPEQKPKKNKELSLYPMSFEEALEKIIKAGPHPQTGADSVQKVGSIPSSYIDAITTQIL